MKKVSVAIIRILFLIIISILFAGLSSAEQWIRTAPTIETLSGVWANSPDDVFIVGNSGTVLHYNGTAWSESSQSVHNLNAVWGSSASDVFAVGNSGTVLHYNGTAWSESSQSVHDLNAVWGSPASDVFAVGDSGTILNYDGNAWSEMTSGTTKNLNGVWGSSASDVFAVGEDFTILYYDGSDLVFVQPSSSTLVDLNAVWGYASDSVFAVGEAGTIAWYNDNVWSLVSSELSINITLNAVWGASACNIYAAGINTSTNAGTIYNFDGREWSSQTSLISPSNLYPLSGVHGTSMRDIFIAGNAGTLLTYDPEGDIYPEVCATSPADHALEVSPGSSIYALFSTGMDPDTINTSSFTLTTGNDTVSGTVTYEAGGFAVFTPDADLSYARTYVATISTDVEDPYGYAMAEEYSWDFTTTILLLDSDDDGGCFISAAAIE